ncbi:MAG: ribonuclease HII [Chitinophagaceae bacterium]|nr:MAG: ribonuclease HII [Chitinophagaceae bacterium]
MLAPFLHQHLIEAGIDEAGRGCYAGPVFAAAVILPKDFRHPLLNDSKQLNEKQRDLLRPLIEKESIAFGVGQIDQKEIDRINILQASFRAMHLSIEQLAVTPEILLVDGNRFKTYPFIPHQCIVKGDGKIASIAAASILAKTYRDAYMKKIHLAFPQYGWDKNKGYGTQVHRDAIARLGLCIHHRKSFKILPAQK